MTPPLPPVPPHVDLAELRRLLVLADDSDAALENLLECDEETIALAGSDADDAEDALRDALREAAPALIERAERAEALRLLQIDDDPRGLRCSECGQWWAEGDAEWHWEGCVARPFTTTEGTR